MEDSDWRKKFDHQYGHIANEPMSLEHALWFARDIVPMTNIDCAAKTLAKEVARLEKILGMTPTEPDQPKVR